MYSAQLDGSHNHKYRELWVPVEYLSDENQVVLDGYMHQMGGTSCMLVTTFGEALIQSRWQGMLLAVGR